MKSDSAESPTVAGNEASPAPPSTSDAPPPTKPTTEAPPAPLDPITASGTEAAQTPTPARSEPELSDAAPALVEELRRAREAAEAKAQAEANTPAIVEWLTESRISGVRLSPTNSKVILNGEAYGEGEYVNFQLGLKVIRIEEKRILFADDSGKKYMKRI